MKKNRNKNLTDFTFRVILIKRRFPADDGSLLILVYTVQELVVFRRRCGRVQGARAVRKIRTTTSRTGVSKPGHAGGKQIPAQAEAVRKRSWGRRRRKVRGFLQLLAGQKGARAAAVLQSGGVFRRPPAALRGERQTRLRLHLPPGQTAVSGG